MIYQHGDVVALRGSTSVPLPCRVLTAVAVESGDESPQLLELEPLGRRWTAGTILLRLDSAVTPVAARQTLRSGGDRRPAIVLPGGRQGAVDG
ncbi:MAG TPA: hypothetical protein VGR62_23725 [Candidatus Binatia bacterium]|jgi:hypothetical protein|nr:hypothetical protein [Candidatus Binatia bacterium]